MTLLYLATVAPLLCLTVHNCSEETGLQGYSGKAQGWICKDKTDFPNPLFLPPEKPVELLQELRTRAEHFQHRIGVPWDTNFPPSPAVCIHLQFGGSLGVLQTLSCWGWLERAFCLWHSRHSEGIWLRWILTSIKMSSFLFFSVSWWSSIWWQDNQKANLGRN